MKISLQVRGLDQAARKLDAVHNSMQARKVERVLLTFGARPLRDEWRRRAPKDTGTLRKAIKAKIGKRHGAWLSSAFAAIGRKRSEAPYAHIVLLGAEPHFITAKNKRVLKLAAGLINAGARFAKWVRHPGVRGNDFTEDGLAAMAPSIDRNIANELKRMVDEAAR